MEVREVRGAIQQDTIRCILHVSVFTVDVSYNTGSGNFGTSSEEHSVSKTRNDNGSAPGAITLGILTFSPSFYGEVQVSVVDSVVKGLVPDVVPRYGVNSIVQTNEYDGVSGYGDLHTVRVLCIYRSEEVGPLALEVVAPYPSSVLLVNVCHIPDVGIEEQGLHLYGRNHGSGVLRSGVHGNNGGVAASSSKGNRDRRDTTVTGCTTNRECHVRSRTCPCAISILTSIGSDSIGASTAGKCQIDGGHRVRASINREIVASVATNCSAGRVILRSVVVCAFVERHGNDRIAKGDSVNHLSVLVALSGSIPAQNVGKHSTYCQ